MEYEETFFGVTTVLVLHETASYHGHNLFGEL